MQNRDPNIFICYSRGDSEFAIKLAKNLREQGVSVWIDQLDVAPGERWDRVTEQALFNCTSVIAILSPESVASENVMDEIGYALDEGKQILPVLYLDCSIPFRIRRLQRIDFTREYGEGFSNLLRTLNVDYFSAEIPIDATESSIFQEEQKKEEEERLEKERQKKEEEERLEAERQKKEEEEKLEAERRQKEEEERLEAERKQKEEEERLEAERQKKEEKKRLKAERQKKEKEERLEAERSKKEEKARKELERRKKKEQESLQNKAGTVLVPKNRQVSEKYVKNVLRLVRTKRFLVSTVIIIAACIIIPIIIGDGQETSDTEPKYNLTLDEQGNGEIESYTEGVKVILKPVPEWGWEFYGWSGDINSSAEEITFVMESDMNITAIFKQKVSSYVWKTYKADIHTFLSSNNVLGAICLAIDENEISRKTSNYYESLVDLKPDHEYSPYIYSSNSIEEAKKLLGLAGLPHGFPLDMYISADDQILNYIANMVKDYLAEISIEAELHVFGPDEFIFPEDNDYLLIEFVNN